MISLVVNPDNNANTNRENIEKLNRELSKKLEDMQKEIEALK